MSHLVINTFRMRPGVSPERFEEFSSRIDQPTLSTHAELITRFDVHRVMSSTEGVPVDADIVEIMEVSDWEQWVAVRDGDPSLLPVTTGFDELVDPDSVRSSHIVLVPKGH
jgi:hypothetical protein